MMNASGEKTGNLGRQEYFKTCNLTKWQFVPLESMYLSLREHKMLLHHLFTLILRGTKPEDRKCS